MSADNRLRLALENGVVSVPEAGRLAVFGPVAGADLSALPKDRCDIISTFRPDTDHFEAQGWTCRVAPEGRYAFALVFVARARALTLARLALAAEVSDGLLAIDGAKTDGVEAILKVCRRMGETGPPLSKAHGKVFTFAPGPDDVQAMQEGPAQVNGTYVTVPGVFSSDGVDPGSALLATTLPDRLGAVVADFGAGWGYLAHQVSQARQDVTTLHLVEADCRALDCARQNVPDPRAVFHWADVTTWQAPDPLDTVVMNPPFHIGRSADPALGRAFIEAAARSLKPQGVLYLVANRHLSYEDKIEALFGRVERLAEGPQFKVIGAARPLRPGSRAGSRTGPRAGR